MFIASNELADKFIILSNISSDFPMDGTGLTISLIVLSGPILCLFKCKIKLDRTFVQNEHNEQPTVCEYIYALGIVSISSGENNVICCFCNPLLSSVLDKFVFEYFFFFAPI